MEEQLKDRLQTSAKLTKLMAAMQLRERIITDIVQAELEKNTKSAKDLEKEVDKMNSIITNIMKSYPASVQEDIFTRYFS